MVIPTLLLSPSGSRDRSGTVALTTSGAVRQVPGRFGSAWMVEEGATNLLVNPRAGVDLGAINANGQTHTRLTGQAIAHPDGFTLDTAVRATWLNTNAGGYAQGMSGLSTPSGAGQPVTCQALIRAVGSTIGKTGRMFAFSTGGATASQSLTLVASVPLTGAWQLVSGSGTLDAAGRTDFALFIGLNAAQAGDILEITAVAVTDRPYRTTYVDGSLGTGYAWSGTPHASRSTRASAQVSYTPPAGRQTVNGSLAMRVQRTTMAGAEGYARLFNWGSPYNADDYLAGLLNAAGTVSMEATTAGASSLGGSGTVTGHVGGTSYPVIFDWSPTGITITTPLGSATRARSTPDGLTAPDPSPLRIGSQDGAQQFLNGTVESVLMFDRPLTADERTTLLAMQAPWAWNSLFPPIGGLARIVPAEPLALTRAPRPEPLALSRVAQEIS